MRSEAVRKVGGVMSHTPYGYKILNGRAVVDATRARQIVNLFDEYIKGASFKTAAEITGIAVTHSVVGRILKNEIYLGTEFYPAIIDKDRFDAAASERLKRATVLRRIYEYTDELVVKEKKYTYHLRNVPQKYDNPFRQAEYAYSLIESEETDG